jgi:DNA/RNA endonuclease YhcR with UshA esterase domain
MRFYLLAIVAGCGLASLFATAGVKVTQTLIGDEAIDHLGETNTVCGMIASAKYVKGAPGNPTYLNFDRSYPEQSCSAVIAEATRARFKEAPETVFKGKWVCVTGVITADFRGKPQIAVSDPAQIVVQDEPTPPATN